MFLEIPQDLQQETSTRVSFLIQLQVSDLQIYLKRDPGAGVLLWVLRNFLEHILLQNTSGG